MLTRRVRELGLDDAQPIPAHAGDPSRPAAARTTRPRQAEPSSTNSAPGMTAAGGAFSPPPPGWSVIATRGARGWRMTRDAEVSPEDARKLVEQGRALTTQRRAGDGFELLFRWKAKK